MAWPLADLSICCTALSNRGRTHVGLHPSCPPTHKQHCTRQCHTAFSHSLLGNVPSASSIAGGRGRGLGNHSVGARCCRQQACAGALHGVDQTNCSNGVSNKPPLSLPHEQSATARCGVAQDEPFHVRQTRQYCGGNWTDWDPKITTFPGLYVAGVVYARLMQLVSVPWRITTVSRQHRSPLCTSVCLHLMLLGGYSRSARIPDERGCVQVDTCSTAALRTLNAVLSVACLACFVVTYAQLHPRLSVTRCTAAVSSQKLQMFASCASKSTQCSASLWADKRRYLLQVSGPHHRASRWRCSHCTSSSRRCTILTPAPRCWSSVPTCWRFEDGTCRRDWQPPLRQASDRRMPYGRHSPSR